MSKLTNIFSTVLHVPEHAVVDELSPENTPSWDSLSAIILLTEIEKAFDTRFEYNDAMNIKNVGDAKALLRKYGCNPDV